MVNADWKKRIPLKGIMLFCFVTVWSMCAGSSYAEENEQVIRFGYYDMGDYYRTVDGAVYSMDTEYLEKIAEYTGLTIEYVYCNTWKQATQMLQDHEIDMIGTMQWSEEREAQYAICQESYGITVAELVALPESEFVYEDYKAIGQAKIGCVENYVRLEELQELFGEHDITPEIFFYETQEKLIKALESGEVDLAAANAHTVKKEWTVVEKITYSSLYFASWSGNEQLTDRIDTAIRKIHLDYPEFDDEILKEYFPIVVNSPLTKKELDCIAGSDVYTVYFDPSVPPLSSYDDKTG